MNSIPKYLYRCQLNVVLYDIIGLTSNLFEKEFFLNIKIKIALLFLFLHKVNVIQMLLFFDSILFKMNMGIFALISGNKYLMLQHHNFYVSHRIKVLSLIQLCIFDIKITIIKFVRMINRL